MVDKDLRKLGSSDACPYVGAIESGACDEGNGAWPDCGHAGCPVCTGKADRPTAHERLAKIVGILLAYPDIHVKIDGFTDSSGTLSQQRAEAVRSYLASQGGELGLDDDAGLRTKPAYRLQRGSGGTTAESAAPVKD